MIKLDSNSSCATINISGRPILDLGKIVFSTSDKEWVARLFNASLNIKFECVNNSNVITGTFSEPLVFSAFITPYHKQPVMEINRQVSFSNEFGSALQDCTNWKVSFELTNLLLRQDESLNIHLIDKVKSNEILDKLRTYLFEKIDFYNSYELITISINSTTVLKRITFSEEFIQENINYDSKFTFENYFVNCTTYKDQLRNLLPYTLENNQYSINLAKLNTLIDNFHDDGVLLKEEEFGSKNDGLLYYLNRNLKRNASLLAYNTTNQQNEIYPSSLLEKIDSAFNINLKYIDLKSPLLCFIFKKTILSISSSQIFNENGKEHLRVFIDVDSYLMNIKDLGKSIKFQIELYDKSKIMFFSKEFHLFEIVKNEKFVPPYFEVLSTSKEQIFSSVIKVFLNDRLHDKVEGGYIRNIKLNLNIKS